MMVTRAIVVMSLVVRPAWKDPASWWTRQENIIGNRVLQVRATVLALLVYIYLMRLVSKLRSQVVQEEEDPDSLSASFC